ncbi:MAG: dihydrodipicolinate synthase family protein [Planctomycetota bacterium]
MKRLQGLVAATYTPFDDGGAFNPDMVKPLVERLLSEGVDGLYVCGSTGEGMSLSTTERKAVLESYVEASAGRVPVIAQVGHNSIAEARELSRHAQQSGADAVSATCPSYFKVDHAEQLIECMAELASAAGDLPFYYYHIPALTGSTIDMPAFLSMACESIPNLVGLKYADTKLFEYQTCLLLQERRFDVVWGCDEMLLGALATGASAAIGSTYNVAAPLYRRLIDCVAGGRLDEAQELQMRSVQLVRALCRYPFHPAMKALLTMRGLDVGGCRLPLGKMTATDVTNMRSDLERIGYFEWGIVNEDRR